MELFHIKHDIPFMKYAGITTVISAVTFVAAVLALIFMGLNFSVDFTGGTVMELNYPHAVDAGILRTTLQQHGFKDASVQNFGSSHSVLVQLPLKPGTTSTHISDVVMEALRTQDNSVTLRRVDFVGPQVGAELVNDGGLALLLVCFGIMVYLAIRFEWRFAVAAIIANMHDVVIILGFFAFFQWEFSLAVLAGVLAVLGYSVNESVVVFDRIRENFRVMRTGTVPEIIDNAITRTMSRTLITHTMTELMVLSMLFFGGHVLFYFALALTIGIVFGIYSSVLVASPIVMWLGVSKQNLMPVKKEGAELDAMP